MRGQMKLGSTVGTRGLLVFACLVSALAFGLPDRAQAAEPKVDIGKFCQLTGEGAGECRTPRGLAVNLEASGGATAGDVYVADSQNNRVDVFSATGTFLSAFGLDVGGAGIDTCTTTCVAGTASGAAGSLNLPVGVAIDQPTGTVYVTSALNQRVDVYSAAGVFEGAFGWKVNVAAPAEALQFCTSLSGCQAGTKGAAAGQFALANGVANLPAVDPTDADLFVPDEANLRIDELEPQFNANHEVVAVSFLRGFGWKVKLSEPLEELQECTLATGCQKGTSGAGAGQFRTEGLTSLAVDSTGAIYAVTVGGCNATAPCRVQKFAPDLSSVADFAPAQLKFTTGTAANQEALAVAVDPATDDVVVAKKETATSFRALEFDSSGTLLATSPTEGTGLAGSFAADYGLAVGTSELTYLGTVNTIPAGQVYILGPEPAPEPVEIQCPSAEVRETEVTCSGTVGIPQQPESGEGYPTTYRFEFLNIEEAGAVWTPFGETRSLGSTPGLNPVPATAIRGLEPNTAYEFRLAATTAPTTLSAPIAVATRPAPPEIVQLYANPVTADEATLSAMINARNSATTYFLEWGPTEGYGDRVPINGEASIGGGDVPVTVSQPITGLQASTTYYFRVVASNHCNAADPTESCAVEAARTFTTPNVLGLPDDRAYELVSPADKGPVAVTSNELATQLVFQASAGGNSIVYSMKNGLLGSTAGGDTRYLATRMSSGWQSTQLTPPALVAPIATSLRDGTGYYLSYTDDLGCGIVESIEPLTVDTPASDVTNGVVNLYRRNEDGSYTLLSNRAPTNPGSAAPNGIFYGVVGVSEDCSRVYFETEYQLMATAASELYEWSEGRLSDAGTLPDGAVPAPPPSGGLIGLPRSHGGGTTTLVDAKHSRWNAVSEDGVRVFFNAISDEGNDAGGIGLFVRTAGGETVDASQSQLTVDNGPEYQAASTDGSRLFFTSNYGLTADSSSGLASCSKSTGKGCDLYEYEVDSGQLADLSADGNAADAEGANVGGVLGLSNDGSYVYFAAQGQLVPERGNTEAENKANGGFFNVYLAHEGHLSFVGLITASDLRQSENGAAAITNPQSWVSQVTPDGQRLLFPSSAIVTGYESNGDTEAYLYSAESGTTVCVSCNPDGQPPAAGFKPLELNQAAPFQPRGPRTLSADGGRVFFSSPEVLAPGAVEGARAHGSNLYEWENGTVSVLLAPTNGAAAPKFVDASPSGDDVFVTTNAQLTGQDTDNGYDLYDIRVGGGFTEPGAPPPGCDPLLERSCTGTATAPPPVPINAATQGFDGPGNPKASSPGKHHKRKHHKRKHHKRKHHHKKHGGKQHDKKHRSSSAAQKHRGGK